MCSDDLSKDEVMHLRQAKAAFNNIDNRANKQPTLDTPNLPAAEKRQAELEEDIKNFIADGGKITIFEDGETGYTPHKSTFVISARTSKNRA